MRGSIVRAGVVFLTAFLLSATIVSCGFAAEETKPGEFSSDDFAYESKCRQCHAIIYSEWEGTMHFNAYLDPFYLEEVKVASNDTDGALDEFCSRCHTPIGVISAEIPPIDGSNMSDIAKLGVQCDFCHVVSGSNGTGNAPFTVSPGNTKWGPFDDAKSAYHDSEYMELYTRSEYCGMCHQVINPVNGLVIDDTYSSWNQSSYAEENVACQDCHMTPGITEYEAKPGRSGSGAPKRDNIYTHDIVGGNAFIPAMFEAGNIAGMAVERLQRAATMTVSAPETALQGEKIDLEVAVTNSGAGHNIPTGVAELRQMWLEVVVTDSSGREIYSSGTYDAKGNIAGAKKIYNNVLADGSGNVTTNFWIAGSILEDNRIAPGETVTQTYNFTVPENVAYPLEVETKLNYRSAPQDMIDRLLGPETTVPVVIMNQVTTEIYDPSTPPEERKQSSPGFGIAGTLTGLSLIMYAIRKNKGGN